MFQGQAIHSLWDAMTPAVFGVHYPQSPIRMAHAMSAHPLLQRGALAALAARLAQGDVECRQADSRHGAGFPMAAVPRDALPDLIARRGDARIWIMLKHIEQLPDYRALLEAIVDPLRPVITARTGTINSLKGFVFISPPGAVTPLHFDPEFNILMQLEGQKIFATLPPLPPFLHVAQEAHFHRTGDNLLPWQDAHDLAGQRALLDAGDALFVPYKAPHWVGVRDAPSLSLSITWRTGWSDARDDAAMLAHWLGAQRLGHCPPRPWPHGNRMAATAYRLLRKVRLA